MKASPSGQFGTECSGYFTIIYKKTSPVLPDEVLVENIGLYTKPSFNVDNELFTKISKSYTDKERTNNIRFGSLVPMISFTPPIIRRGKSIKIATKGITLAQQQALEDWYIEYYFTDTSMELINKG